MTKICLLIPALCSIILGFSIVMHGLLKVNRMRFDPFDIFVFITYYCIPYTLSLIGKDLNIYYRLDQGVKSTEDTVVFHTPSH